MCILGVCNQIGPSIWVLFGIAVQPAALHFHISGTAVDCVNMMRQMPLFDIGGAGDVTCPGGGAGMVRTMDVCEAGEPNCMDQVIVCRTPMPSALI